MLDSLTGNEQWKVSVLTLGAFDPISREPNFKKCAVRVEKFFETLK